MAPAWLLVGLQAIFLAIGLSYLGFSNSWLDALTAVVVALVSEYALARMNDKEKVFPASPLAAALGIALFFRAESVAYVALAAFVAIASKYVIRVPGGAHIFNPSNFAVVTLAFLFPSAVTIELTQWGSDPYLFALFAAAALAVAWRARVLATTFSFLASYTLLLIALLPFIEYQLAAHHLGLLSPSLILFASFMITDPKTAPTEARARVLHGVSVALLFFILEIIGVRYSIFVASFLIAAFSGLQGYAEYALSRYGRRLIPAAYPRNVLSGACIAILAVMLFAKTVTPLSDAAFSPLHIASEYVLYGIESPRLLQCSAASSFSPSTEAPFEFGGLTTGAVWRDYDGDGWEDMYLSAINKPGRLLRNTGVAFEDVTIAAGLPVIPSSAALWVDYDNDRLPDLFIVTFTPITAMDLTRKGVDLETFAIDTSMREAPIRAYRNLGGRFVEVTEALGLDELRVRSAQSGALSSADYDNDGDLDLILVTEGTHLFFQQKAVSLARAAADPFFPIPLVTACGTDADRVVAPELRDRIPPIVWNEALRVLSGGEACLLGVNQVMLVQGTRADYVDPLVHSNLAIVQRGTGVLLENTGERFVRREDFTDSIEQVLAREKSSYGTEGDHPHNTLLGVFYQVLSFDYDDDGDQDVFISSDWGRNLLMKNEGELHFIDATSEAGLDYYGTGMGIDVTDFDRDGLVDLFVNNARADYLFRRTDTGFRLSGDEIGFTSFGWGTSFIDYDLDGWDDLIIGSGELGRTHNLPVDELVRNFFRKTQLYRNEQGAFREVTWDVLCPAIRGVRALAVSDHDNDGDQDVFVGDFMQEARGRGGNVLYKNEVTGRHSVSVRVEGTLSNAMGVGARVAVTSGTTTQTKVVLAGNSFHSQNGAYLVFGLGESAKPVSIRVTWPSGEVSELQQVPADTRLTVREGVPQGSYRVE